MKRSKRLFILLGVFAVICVSTVVLMQTEENKEKIKNSGEIVLEVSSDNVTSLSWEYGDTSLAFHKDDKWLYDEDEAFPVDEEKIHDLLEPFESFGVSFIIEDVTDYGMYGLDEPICTIQFTADEQPYEITLGDFSNMDSERYVSIGDGNVYLAKNDPLDQYDAVLKDMIKHDDDLAYDKINQIKFEGAEEYTIFYDEESDATYCADDVYFTERDGETLPLDTNLVGSYLENLTTLNPINYVSYNVTDEELASYHLDNPELTITVDYLYEDDDKNEVSDTFVISVSRDPEKLAAAEEAEKNEEDPEEVTGYVRIGESQIIYEISEYVCDSLFAASYDELRHRKVLTADFEDIYQLDISLEGNNYTVLADKEDENERIWTYQEEEIEITDIKTSLKNLSADNADSFVVEDSSGTEEISLTVYLDNETYPSVKIELYRYDGTNCLAKVDGKTFALIPRSDVVDLIEAVNSIVLN